jgi:thiazole/oxazole-forming peptide maturase SagD family component
VSLPAELEARFAGRAIRLRSAVERRPDATGRGTELLLGSQLLRLAQFPLGAFLELFDRGLALADLPARLHPEQATGALELLARLDRAGWLDPALPPLPVGAPRSFLRRLERLPVSPPGLSLSAWLAEADKGSPTPEGETRPIFGLAAARDEESARLAALGEAYERAAAAARPEKLATGLTWRALTTSGRAALAPERFQLYSSRQLETGQPGIGEGGPASPSPRPFDAETPTAWVLGEELGSGRELWLPAPWVLLPHLCAAGEPFLTEGTSTGLATGPDRDSARLSGLLEVVERDAVALAWLQRRPWKRLALAGLGDLDEMVETRLGLAGYRLHLADLTSDLGLPTIVAVLEAPAGGIVLGSACRFRAEEAALKAVLEAHQARLSWSTALERGETVSGETGPDEIRTFADHALLYTRPEAARRVLGRLTNADHHDPPPAWEAEGAPLAALVRHLERAGHPSFAVDLPTPDPSSNWAVVRALVPSLVPLNGRDDLRPLGSARLLAADDGRSWNEAELEEAPHPFP